MSLFNISNRSSDEATMNAAKMMASLSISKEGTVYNNGVCNKPTAELQELKDRVARLEAENRSLAARPFYNSAQVADAEAKFRDMEDANATLRRQCTALSGFLAIVLPLFIQITSMFEGVQDAFREGFFHMVSILSAFTSEDVSEYGWIASTLPSLPLSRENFDSLLGLAAVMGVTTTADLSCEQLQSSISALRSSLSNMTTPRSPLFAALPEAISSPRPMLDEDKLQLRQTKGFSDGMRPSRYEVSLSNCSSGPAFELEQGVRDVDDFVDQDGYRTMHSV
ncbi:hypothetical protein CYLTODRAFT_44196 [Cylindrobasidium torrendii FP15055 ss-10]|uniref:Uncharacterized protein n=1 Tax=Cylindrobasidium torrendii FP15055 ss-10 TaxID=1314674 RepID=A0A0D7B6D2_9AGAR|nr:hypothetical protein CYLTODRAFT_44196 [Cylindrobasidium torrendii FP15055 ss-10]